jgi:type II secretory pathway predicted ATPase ExeA
MSSFLKKLHLEFNPFEPAASGVPVGGDHWIPPSWCSMVRQKLTQVAQGQGVKALAIAGEYGSGKTYLLRWLHTVELPRQRIRPYYFDNPGVQFYDLANSLLRQVGRKDFAKCIWELAAIHVGTYQRSLFSRGYEEYLAGYRTRKRPSILADLQDAIKKAEITADEEIAHRLAMIVADTPSKPYFEYRDFIAGKRDTLVAEGEEAPYFNAILKTLRLGAGIEAVAFLIDEFEEVSLQKRLTRREAHDYLATLKRLINLTQGENLWLIAGMTPDAVQKTKMLEPALWERFTAEGQFQLEVPPLDADEATELVRHRLKGARAEKSAPPSPLFPFSDDFAKKLTPATISNPRRLVKVCFYAVSRAQKVSLPFTDEYMQDIENKAYPALQGGDQP